MSSLIKLLHVDNLMMVLRNMGRVGFLTNLKYLLADLVFELRYGIDTVRPIQLEDLEIDSINKSVGNYYQGTNGFVFNKIFSFVDLDISNGAFLDLGSGKGKALFLASKLGFSKVIGVEFSHELVEISRKNLEKFRKKTRARTQFEIHHGDASEFPIPIDTTLVYFANPFDETLTEKVIRNITDSYHRKPREIWIIHLYPKGNIAFSRHPSFSLHRQLPEDVLIYRFK